MRRRVLTERSSAVSRYSDQRYFYARLFQGAHIGLRCTAVGDHFVKGRGGSDQGQAAAAEFAGVADGYGLARDGQTDRHGRPKSLRITAWLLLVSEMQLPGWYSVLERGLIGLARQPKTQRIGQELLTRYVRL